MSNQLRKAAILVKSLDKSTAEALLAQMASAAAKRVLAAAKALTGIDPDEQKEVMRDFLARQSGKSVTAPVDASSDVELSLSSSASESVEGAAPKPEPTPASQVAPLSNTRFAFITAESIEPLASVLSREQPQLAALILAHLPAEHSAAVIALLELSARATIVQRIAEIDDTGAGVLDEIEQELKTRLAREQLRIKGSAQGIAALSGILQASDPNLRRQISTAIGSRRAVMASPQPLGREPAIEGPALQSNRADANSTKEAQDIEKSGQSSAITFTALNALDDISLAAVFGAVTPQVAILALVGADEPLVGRILRLLPRKEAASFRKKLDEVGPLRLKEVQVAQDQMSRAAGALLMDRRISISAPQRLRLTA
jgi:flagellar motor switch protein FliG